MQEAYPFQCFRCEKQPKESFRIYAGTDDWLIVYPDIALIHIHYGRSTHTPEENIEESRWHLDTWNGVVKQYPNQKFFGIGDFSRKDDTETLEEEAKENYKRIRTHPNLGGGAMYGQTLAMAMIFNILNIFSKRSMTIRKTLVDAEEDYERWYMKQKQRMGMGIER